MKPFLPAILKLSDHSRKVSSLFLGFGVLLLACRVVNAQYLETDTPQETFEASQTNDTIGVTQLRRSNPEANGSGVKVAQPEALCCGSGNEPFQVSPNYVAQSQIFTYVNARGQSSNVFPNNVGDESEHADMVGDNFYGRTNGSNPKGVAYGVSHVDNYNANYFYRAPISSGNTAIPAKVANQSFIFGQRPDVDQTYDNYIARFGTIIASGVGNGGPPNSSATCYNGIGVAAFGSASSVGPTVDNGRSKPDITAPASATSYSTPLVSGAAAILVQAAGTNTSASDPRTVKALLLNGAIKPLYQPNAADRWTHTDTAPLDRRYGSGILNVFNSYRQFQGGRNSFTTSTTSTVPPATGGNVPVRAGWDFNSISSTSSADKVNHYFFNLTGGPSDSFTATATLVWNRQNNQSSINNLDLFLYSEDGTLFAPSVSTVDNVEHLFLQALPPGRYDLEVFKRRSDVVSSSETYALAFNSRRCN